MFQSIIEYIIGLVKEQLEEMVKEVIEKIIELLGEDDSVIETWLDTLSPTRRMLAEQLLEFANILLVKVADELFKEDEV